MPNEDAGLGIGPPLAGSVSETGGAFGIALFAGVHRCIEPVMWWYHFFSALRAEAQCVRLALISALLDTRMGWPSLKPS